jgi:hypothetical protein
MNNCKTCDNDLDKPQFCTWCGFGTDKDDIEGQAKLKEQLLKVK